MVNRGEYSLEMHKLNSRTSSATYLPCLVPVPPSPSCPRPSSPSENQSWPSGKRRLNYNTSFDPTLQLRAPQGWIQQGCVLFWRASTSFFFKVVWNTLILWRIELYSTSPPLNKREEERAPQTERYRGKGHECWGELEVHCRSTTEAQVWVN